MSEAIIQGWFDAMTYCPQVKFGWHAITIKVNDRGEEAGTCVGTRMGFAPVLYYYRPRNKHAGHGYGPVNNGHKIQINARFVY